LREQSSQDVYIAAGGALFYEGNPNELQQMGYGDGGSKPVQVVPDGSLAPYRGIVAPRDGTAIRNFNNPDVYLTFGGTGFYESDSNELHAFYGIGDSQVVVLPIDGVSRVVRNGPRSGALFREHGAGQAYAVNGGSLAAATPCAGAPVAIVPAGSLERRFS
jgi:hypothetical protein